MEPSQKAWHCFSIDELRRLFATSLSNGLTSEEAKERLSLYGKNVLMREKKRGVAQKILAQFKSSLVLMLLGAGIVTLVLGHYVDSLVIFIALFINVIIGTLQEERASRAFEKLNASQERHALVIRDGTRMNVLAETLVPGDIVILEGGFFVPADVRIVEEKDLKINEAALTGEWLAVSKNSEVVEDRDTPLAERTNMAWMGTLIESGHGKGIVVATGNQTQVGGIALALGSIQEQSTPLQKNVQHVARFLSYVVIVAIVVIALLGVANGLSFIDIALMSIAVAVATIPSGLPAAVTVVLAIGMEALLKRGGLVRNLLAAETLGSTTVILTDKTGTLTEAQMKITGLYTIQGVRTKNTAPVGNNRFLLELAVLGCEAFVEEATDAPSKLTVHGRPMEKAILVAGLEAAVAQDVLFKDQPRIDYLPFTSKRRCSVSLHKQAGKKQQRLVFTGEPEKLLDHATCVYVDGKRKKATEKDKKHLYTLLETNAAQGKRLIGVSYKDAPIRHLKEGDDIDDLLHNTVFVGFLAFEDPIRTDVAQAIEEVKEAGARVIMLTGDNPKTAHHIAQQVGIVMPGDELVIRGQDIEEWNDDELYTKLQTIRVIARAIPAHKLRIARVLKNNGEVVAMTGDGINDAPALRAASIGIAVGSGTEVAKEASDLVLIDNSFSIIVAAIEEGRRIIDNLKKIIAYLLSTSFSEIFVIIGALITGSPLPLLPAQILWANIVEEGLMSFSFAFEKHDPHAMKRNPRSVSSKRILTKELRTLIITVSTITGVLLIALYYFLLHINTPIEELRTFMFIALSLDAIFFTFSLKSLDTPIWRIELFSNKYLIGALLTSVLLLFSALVFDPLSSLLSLSPLTTYEVALLFGLGLTNLATIEAVKYVLFMRNKH